MAMFFSAIILFVLGIIIGSFANVVILRYGVTSLSGRSGCQSCSTQLRWYELLPIISYIALRGRCRTCKAKISIQYPLVEFLTGIGFVGIGYLTQNPVLLIVSMILLVLCIILSVYDIYHYILLPGLMVVFGMVSLFARIYMHYTIDSLLPWWMYVVPIIVALPFFLVWHYSEGRLIGFGDIILLAMIGLGVGVFGGVAVLFLSSWVGALFGVVYALFAKKTTNNFLTLKIPFGPFLILGFAVVYSLQVYGNLESIANLFF